jgi:hypothetical protein
MCNFLSGIITRENCLVSAVHDSHESLIKENGLDDTTSIPDFVRVELLPDDDVITDAIKKWHLKVDQDLIPDWFNREISEIRMISELKKQINVCVLINKKIKFLTGSYKLIFNSSVGEMQENSRIGKMLGHSSIEEMQENSIVGEMLGHSSVLKMIEKSSIGKMRGNSSVRGMLENSSIEEVLDNSIVGEMMGYSSIGEMQENSSVGKMWEKSSVKKMLDNSVIRSDKNGNIIVANKSKVIQFGE